MFSSRVTPFSGISNAVTFFGPIASARSLSTSAESMPPETPRTAFVSPVAATYFFISPRR